MDEPGPDPVATLSDADRSSFGFDRPEDELIARVRSATDTLELGRIGAYELVAIAGTGGQGVVYRARQSGTGREVALKRLLAGSWAGDAARARFAREIETDAALRHPNIVTVYGVEEVEGQPLLAMEWVDGSGVDRWAAGRGVPEILRVFLKICDGVQHAHQRGVIHRDLKPSNILVDAVGEPRVLDFGLAKLTGSDPGLRSRLTASGGFLGTLAYSAPEQVRADADGVDVRTDVYALGCVLYQCLTGRAPFGGGDAGGNVEALSRAICHEEPARPSSLRPGLDADLDAIVARAMAKDKAQRYQSVDALGADVRRSIEGEPVEARRGVRWYVLRRTLRHHRVPAAIGAAFVLVAGIGAVVSLSMWRVAEARRLESDERRREAEGIADVLAGTLAAGSHHEIRTDAFTVRQLLDQIASVPPYEWTKAPEVEATVKAALGNGYRSVSAFDKADELLAQSLDIRRRLHGQEHPLVARSLLDRAWLLHDRGEYVAAEASVRNTLAMQRRLRDVSPADLSGSLFLLADLLGHLERQAEALPLVDESLAIRVSLYEPAHPRVIECRYLRSDLLGEHRRAEMIEEDHRLFDALHARYGSDHPAICEAYWHLAAHAGDPAEKSRLYAEAEGAFVRAFGEGHPMVARVRLGRAITLLNGREFAPAEAMLQEALRVFRAAYPEGNPDAADALNNLGTLHYRQADYTPAEQFYRDSLAMRRRFLGDRHPLVARSFRNLADTLRAAGRTPDAVAPYRESLRIARASLGADHPTVIEYINALAIALTQIGELDEAERLFRERYQAVLRRHGPSSWLVGHSLRQVGFVLFKRGDLPAAERVLRESIDSLRGAADTPPAQFASALDLLGQVLVEGGTPADAELFLRESQDIRAQAAPDDPERYQCMSVLGEAVLEQARVLLASEPARANTRLAEAESLLGQGYEGLKANSGSAGTPVRIRKALERLARLYDATDRPEKAAELRASLDASSAAAPP